MATPSFSPGPGSAPNPIQGSAEDSNYSAGPEPKSNRDSSYNWRGMAIKGVETGLTTFASIFVLALAGYCYHVYYKDLVLRKVEIAFKPGDPVLDLVGYPLQGQHDTHDHQQTWIRRAEQDLIDDIVGGRKQGHYWLLIGEKGVGKSSMLLDAMERVNGEGISMFEAHADLEIFRVRLGKALNYEFHEDYIGSLFSIKGPRDTTPLLDIERAFNKLEKVAIRRRSRVGRPLVLIINCTHLLRNDHDGQDLLELVQQRAEQWAAANLVTVVLNSDDYWVYERLKQLATRLEVLPVPDLPRAQSLAALSQCRRSSFPNKQAPSPQLLQQVYERVGGRLRFLTHVAKAPDMLRECENIYDRERTWFLNQCGILGGDMDDDVMDQQKYASAAMVLAKALVDLEDAKNPQTEQMAVQNEDQEDTATEDGRTLPEIPLHEARRIMTRADFIQQYDHINVFTIDSRAMVRADSVPMMHAFRSVCHQPGFTEFLDATLQRIGDIESLGRTREVVAKDLWDKRYHLQLGNGQKVIVGVEGKDESS